MALIPSTEILLTLDDFVGGNWVSRFREAALAAGYDWPEGQIGKALSGSVTRHGLDDVEMAWNWWVKNAALTENVKRIHPHAFAKMVGYWITWSRPMA